MMDAREAALYLAEQIYVDTNPGYKLREAAIAVFEHMQLRSVTPYDSITAQMALYILRYDDEQN